MTLSTFWSFWPNRKRSLLAHLGSGTTGLSSLGHHRTESGGTFLLPHSNVLHPPGRPESDVRRSRFHSCRVVGWGGKTARYTCRYTISTSLTCSYHIFIWSMDPSEEKKIDSAWSGIIQTQLSHYLRMNRHSI